MEIKETTIYICEFCRKSYQKIHFAERHEKMCNKNPDNWRKCHSCWHLEKKETKIYSGTDDYDTGEPFYKDVDFLHCSVKKIFLYTPQNEIKDNFHHIDYEGGTFENYPMPKHCDVFNKESNLDSF